LSQNFEINCQSSYIYHIFTKLCIWKWIFKIFFWRFIEVKPDYKHYEVYLYYFNQQWTINCKTGSAGFSTKEAPCSLRYEAPYLGPEGGPLPHTINFIIMSGIDCQTTGLSGCRIIGLSPFDTSCQCRIYHCAYVCLSTGPFGQWEEGGIFLWKKNIFKMGVLYKKYSSSQVLSTGKTRFVVRLALQGSFVVYWWIYLIY
jgi:hypothetical protein